MRPYSSTVRSVQPAGVDRGSRHTRHAAASWHTSQHSTAQHVACLALEHAPQALSRSRHLKQGVLLRPPLPRGSQRGGGVVPVRGRRHWLLAGVLRVKVANACLSPYVQGCWRARWRLSSSSSMLTGCNCAGMTVQGDVLKIVQVSFTN